MASPALLVIILLRSTVLARGITVSLMGVTTFEVAVAEANLEAAVAEAKRSAGCDDEWPKHAKVWRLRAELKAMETAANEKVPVNPSDFVQRASELATAPGSTLATAPGRTPTTAPCSTPATAPGSTPATAPDSAPAIHPGNAANRSDWIDQLPPYWRIGAILGPTASGKSLAINDLRAAGLVRPLPSQPEMWPSDRAAISVIADSDAVRAAAEEEMGATAFDDDAKRFASCELKRAELAMGRLGCVGLSSLPVWLQPYAALSNGQRMRVQVARSLESGCAVDDFGSTVDAQNASVCAAGIARSVRFRG